MTGAIRRYRLVISGRVQGVGLRWRIKTMADKLNLTGWVKNQAETHEVVAEIEGEQAAIDGFLVWLKQNHGVAQVRTIEAAELSPRRESGFKIKQSIWPFL